MMMIETLRLALRAITRNMMRSLLTVLGVVIGVAAVIALVTIGHGTTAKVEAQIAALGANLLTVKAGQSQAGGAKIKARGFTQEDVDAIESQVAGLQAIAPVMSRALLAVAGNANWATTVIGSDANYFAVRNRTLERGRSFTPEELASGQPVCVIGQTTREKLFRSGNPVGRSIRIRQIVCEVIGVMEKRGDGSSAESSDDDLIVMPMRAFQRRLAGKRELNTILVTAHDGVETSLVQRDIEGLLRERRRIAAGQDSDFFVSDMKQVADTMTGTTTVMTGLLAAVAAVSLVVGGIGIMNIMLVSVTERTREIGIRLAIGALGKQVLTQFLVEAVTLSTLGGILGVALGMLIALAALPLLEIPFVFDPVIVIAAVTFSGVIGIAFGYLPARRAARLDPIVALRHE